MKGSISTMRTSGWFDRKYFRISSPLSPLNTLYSKSPNALVIANLLISRPFCTKPPHSFTLYASSALVAFWSQDKFIARPFLQRTARESPKLAQKSLFPTINAITMAAPQR
mmetsp:Transcript_32747/g.24168  ORF Transcript_32747/g.24168 Transcript_32747/m.24168 type:complete len:111 (+) Transcript_32747:245-577(+)